MWILKRELSEIYIVEEQSFISESRTVKCESLETETSLVGRFLANLSIINKIINL